MDYMNEQNVAEEEMSISECSNPYADYHARKGQWVVETQHGSGPGRSYGNASMRQAKEHECLLSSQTVSYAIFDDEDEARKYVIEENDYFDGSDYRPQPEPEDDEVDLSFPINSHRERREREGTGRPPRRERERSGRPQRQVRGS